MSTKRSTTTPLYQYVLATIRYLNTCMQNSMEFGSPRHKHIAKTSTDAILVRLSQSTKLEPSDATQLIGLLKTDMLPPVEMNMLVDAINSKTNFEDFNDTPKDENCKQDCEDPYKYLTEKEFLLLYWANSLQDATQIMARRMVSLGLINANEKTYGKIAAVTVWACKVYLGNNLEVTRALKREVLPFRQKQREPGIPTVYPDPPQKLLLQYEQLYRTAYPHEEPITQVPYYLHLGELRVLSSSQPCRKSKSGFADNLAIRDRGYNPPNKKKPRCPYYRAHSLPAIMGERSPPQTVLFGGYSQQGLAMNHDLPEAPIQMSPVSIASSSTSIQEQMQQLALAPPSPYSPPDATNQLNRPHLDILVETQDIPAASQDIPAASPDIPASQEMDTPRRLDMPTNQLTPAGQGTPAILETPAILPSTPTIPPKTDDKAAPTIDTMVDTRHTAVEGERKRKRLSKKSADDEDGRPMKQRLAAKDACGGNAKRPTATDVAAMPVAPKSPRPQTLRKPAAAKAAAPKTAAAKAAAPKTAAAKAAAPKTAATKTAAPKTTATKAAVPKPGAAKPPAPKPGVKWPSIPPKGAKKVSFEGSTIYVADYSFRVKPCKGSRQAPTFPYGTKKTREQAWASALAYLGKYYESVTYLV